MKIKQRYAPRDKSMITNAVEQAHYYTVRDYLEYDGIKKFNKSLTILHTDFEAYKSYLKDSVLATGSLNDSDLDYLNKATVQRFTDIMNAAKDDYNYEVSKQDTWNKN